MNPTKPVKRGLRSFALATATTLLCAGAAWSDEVRIQGDVTQTTVLSQSVTAGKGAVSRFSSIGGGADVRGDLELTSIVGQHATISAGPGAQAQTSIASVHGKQKIRGKTRRAVIVKHIVNVGGCMSLGSINGPCQ